MNKASFFFTIRDAYFAMSEKKEEYELNMSLHHFPYDEEKQL